MDNTEIHKEILEELRDLNKSHSELVSVLSLLAQEEIEKRLSHIFTNSAEFLAYKMTNGENSSADIAKLLGVSHTTIANWWNRWEEDFGIVETYGYRNPYKAKYSLVELALRFGEKKETEESNRKEGLK